MTISRLRSMTLASGLTQEEIEELVRLDTLTDLPKSRFASRTAVIEYPKNPRGKKRYHSHIEIYKMVESVAGTLREAGVRPKTVIAAVIPNSLESVVFFFATQWIGGIYAPINPHFEEDLIIDLISRTEAQIVVSPEVEPDERADHPFYEKLNSVAQKRNIKNWHISSTTNQGVVLNIHKDPYDSKPAWHGGAHDFKIDSDSEALRLSPGHGLISVLKHSNIGFAAKSFKTTYDLRSNNSTVCVVGQHDIQGILTLCATFYSGGQVVLPGNGFKPEDFWKYVIDDKVNWLSADVGTIKALADYTEENGIPSDDVHLSFLRSCGDALEAEQVTSIEDIMRAPILESYGTPECAGLATANKEFDFKPGTFGKEVSGCSVIIVHPETKELMGINETGDIAVAGTNVSNGYLNNDEANQECTFVLENEDEEEVYFCSGERGFIDDDGYLTVTGNARELRMLEKAEKQRLAEEQALLAAQMAAEEEKRKKKEAEEAEARKAKEVEEAAAASAIAAAAQAEAEQRALEEKAVAEKTAAEKAAAEEAAAEKAAAEKKKRQAEEAAKAALNAAALGTSAAALADDNRNQQQQQQQPFGANQYQPESASRSLPTGAGQSSQLDTEKIIRKIDEDSQLTRKKIDDEIVQKMTAEAAANAATTALILQGLKDSQAEKDAILKRLDELELAHKEVQEKIKEQHEAELALLRENLKKAEDAKRKADKEAYLARNSALTAAAAPMLMEINMDEIDSAVMAAAGSAEESSANARAALQAASETLKTTEEAAKAATAAAAKAQEAAAAAAAAAALSSDVARRPPPMKETVVREMKAEPAVDKNSVTKSVRVNMDDIDQAIKAHPAVVDARSFAVPDSKYENEIYCAVVPKKGGRVGESWLKLHAQSMLPPMLVPKKFFIVDSIPKMSRAELANYKGLADMSAQKKPAQKTIKPPQWKAT